MRSATRRRTAAGLALAAGWLVAGSAAQSPSPSRLPLPALKLPPGFSIGVYADNVPNARSMTLGPGGTLFVGTRTAGNVYAVIDANQDQKADRVITVATGLDMPNGVAVRNGALFVAEVSRILRFDNIEAALEKPPAPAVVTEAYPKDRHHGWKFMAFGPDGWLYVPVGAPCNVCERPDPRYSTITRIKPDGSGAEVFASGVRNTVGFDWHPVTKALWFTDNGRDMMGDDVPPDELNVAPAKGLHFGFPYCHGGTIADPEFGAKRPCAAFTPPARTLGPHVAALGMRFYTGTMFPAAYRHRILIAEHGSWNRSTPIGYRVMMVTLSGNRVTAYEPFVEGWLQGRKPWGRPVDVLVMPDGALLVSDDLAGVIYRVTYAR
jgi:glucose/arabinose dehydrogenase